MGIGLDLIFPTTNPDATKREIVEDGTVFKLQCRNGTWVAWPVGTWNETERTAAMFATREHRRSSPDWSRRYGDLIDMARGTKPTPLDDVIAVRDVQAAMRRDLLKRERANELAAEENAKAAVALPIARGVAA